jgi:hypothetical protein
MGRGKVLGSSTTAKRWLRRAIGLKAELTEEVGRRWGGGERRRSGEGQLQRGGGGLGGGPMARGRGEGGSCVRCVRAGRKAGCGGWGDPTGGE